MSDIKAGTGATTMAKTEYQIEPGKQEIRVTRVFDAPRDLVFKACTDPNLLARWWGPRRYTTTVDKMEVKPGGMWRFVQKDPAGNEFAFRGVYHEVTAPRRTVQTFEFEGVPGHVLLDTATFEDFDGKTKLTQQSVFQSVEDRDGMVQSGMEEGSTESMDRLAELLAELLKARSTR
jgi:uncharacterized protein YndB with AHSA1/START domain